MKMLITLITLLFCSFAFCDDDGKTNANVKAKAEVEVKGKNSFKWKQAQKGLMKASEMFAQAKMSHKKAIKIKQEVQAQYKAFQEISTKAKTKQEKAIIVTKNMELQKKLEHSQKLEMSYKSEFKAAKKVKAHCEHLKGEYYYDNEMYKKAMTEFKTSASTSVHQSSHKTQYFMGKVYEKRKEYKKAKTCFEKALKIKPDFKLATSALTSVKSILGIDIGVELDLFGG